MGSTTILDLSVSVLEEPKNGKYFYYLLFYAFENNTYPHRPSWIVYRSGTYQECLSYIIDVAAGAEIGLFHTRNGVWDAEKLIADFRYAFTLPYLTTEKNCDKIGALTLPNAAVHTVVNNDVKLPADFVMVDVHSDYGIYHFTVANGSSFFGDTLRTMEWFVRDVVSQNEQTNPGSAEKLISLFRDKLNCKHETPLEFIVTVHNSPDISRDFWSHLLLNGQLIGSVVKIDLVKYLDQNPVLKSSNYFSLPLETIDYLSSIRQKAAVISSDPWDSFDDEDDGFTLTSQPVATTTCSILDGTCESCQ